MPTVHPALACQDFRDCRLGDAGLGRDFGLSRTSGLYEMTQHVRIGDGRHRVMLGLILFHQIPKDVKVILFIWGQRLPIDQGIDDRDGAFKILIRTDWAQGKTPYQFQIDIVPGVSPRAAGFQGFCHVQ